MTIVDVIMSDSLNSSIGPMQTIRRIKNSQVFFHEHGYEINVFTKDDFVGAPKGTPIKKGSKLYDLKRSVFSWLSLHTRLFGIMKYKQTFDISKWMISSYAKLNREPSIVVFHCLSDCYVYLKEYKKPNVKVCLFEHDDGTGKMFFSYYPKLQGSKFEKNAINDEMFVFENIDVKACITKTTERNLINRAPVLKGKTILVINGISDMSEEEKAQSKKIRDSVVSPKYRLVQVGSMNGRKGHREVIEALYRMNIDMRNQIHVSFVGGGYEKQALQSLVADYKLDSIVKFEGIVRNQEVYKYLAKGNIAILISAIEGLPLALIEGMRSSMGIISTRVSGIPEIVNEGVNGVLINPDLDELIDVFNNLDKYDWDKMGVESRKMFDDYYNFPRMRMDYKKMLDKALGC